MKRRHSLFAKLLGLFLLTGLLLALVVQSGFRHGLRDQWREFAQPHLAQYLAYLLDEIGDPPQAGRAQALSQRLPMDISILSATGSWSSGDRVPEVDGFRFRSHLLPDGREYELGWHRGEFLLRVQIGAHWLLIVPGGSGLEEGSPVAALLTIGGVLAVLGLFYFAVRRLFRPIETIRTALVRFGEGELEQRVRLGRRDELGQLAGSVNRMADDIQAMLEAKRQLLLALSHELRSPLTRARVNLELMEKGAQQERLGRDLQEIETLLTELLESERLNSRHAALNLSAVDPMVLIQELAQGEYPDREIRLQLAAHGRFIAIDKSRIRMLIRNLLDNALRHTLEGPPPELYSGYRNGRWSLQVWDHGAGIAAEHLPHILEPFYRADPARRRQTGGFGLGLYLCRKIAEAHGGEIRVESEPGSGTLVEVSLPLSKPEF